MKEKNKGENKRCSRTDSEYKGECIAQQIKISNLAKKMKLNINYAIYSSL